ncbi:U3 small nucleolar RNA-associated protein, partial [Spiromyces aspiralis]
MDIDMTSTLVATGSADSTVKVWDIDGGYCTHSFKGHGGVVSVAKFHPNMKHPRLATGGDDGTIRIWNLSTRKCESVLEGHVSIVRGLDFTTDGRHLVSAGRDSVIHIWDIKARRIVRTIPAYESLESVGLLAPGTGFDKDAYDAAGKSAYGKLVVYSGGENGVIRLWDFDTGKELLRQNKEVNAKHACFDIIYARNSQQLLMVTSDQNILFYDVTRQLTKVRQIAGYNEEITDLRYIGPGNRHLIVATNAEYLKL